MKSILTVSIIVAGLASGAYAADLPLKAAAPVPAPVPTWTGFYLGANGGWGSSNSFNPTTTIVDTGAGILAAPALVMPGSRTNGAVFGGQVGYNWQVSSWVFGVEGDVDGTNLNGTSSTLVNGFQGAGPASGGATQTFKTEWIASARGRVGYAWGPNLFYATGGGAWERIAMSGTAFVNASPNFGAPLNTAATFMSSTKSGWVAGLGFERLISPNWTVRAEYLHYGFSGSFTDVVVSPVTGIGAGAAATIIQSWAVNNVEVVRVGANYKF
jgi:outer membrane immunogenic protein